MILPSLGIYSSLKFIEAAKESLLYYTFGNLIGSDGKGEDSQDASLKKSHTNVWNHMVGGKRVDGADLIPMANRYDWVEGTVYEEYDDEKDLRGLAYYVVLEDEGVYSVFLCLGNNGGVPSTERPSRNHTFAGDTSYIMIGDGYQWMHLYSITNEQWNKFATDLFIPVVEDEDIKNAAIDGAIYAVKVESGGSYPAHATGFIEAPNISGNTTLTAIDSETTLSANTDFYKGSSIYLTSGTGSGQLRDILEYVVTGDLRIILTDEPWDVLPDNTTRFNIAPKLVIDGDGNGAKGRIILDTNLNANTVSRVEILSSGEGYQRATATVTGNTGIIGDSSDAELRPIIPPPNGHGANVFFETQSTRTAISVTTNATDGGILPTGIDFDQVSFILDPALTEGVVTIDAASSFTGGETVTTPKAKAIFDSSSGSTLTLKKIEGIISEGDILTGTTSEESATIVDVDIDYETKRQAKVFTIEVSFAGDNNEGFLANETITQAQTKSSGTVLNTINTDGLLYVVNEVGGFQPSDSSLELPIVGETSGATGRITGIADSQLVSGSGEVLYVNNLDTITRIDGQSETVRVILSF